MTNLLEIRKNTQDTSPKKYRLLRGIVTGFICVLFLVLSIIYNVLLVLGKISAENRIGITEISLVIISFLTVIVFINPNIIKYISEFSLPWGGSFKLKLIEKKQKNLLDNVAFLLKHFLSTPEHAHLTIIANEKDVDYDMFDKLRDELRKLKSMGLIKERADKNISTVANGTKFCPSDIYEITERGTEYLKTIVEIV